MSELDPVLRCDSCQSLVLVTKLHKLGVCPKCGNKRMRSLIVLSEAERLSLVAAGCSKLADQFEVVDE